MRATRADLLRERSPARTPRSGVLGALAFVASLALAVADAAGAAPEPPLGTWLTEDRNAVIQIVPCGAAFCGQIVGIPLAVPGEPIPTDNHGRSQCHLTIIQDATPDGTGWNARITDPRDGSWYHVRLRLDAERRLHVRGYVGIPLLGLTQVWTAFTAPVPADCRLPPRTP
jgi:uncharacterized protein (DUF2147 family)